MSYILPQPLVFQDFHKVPTQLIKNLNPFISGANYRLFRYSEAAEKPMTGLGNYDRAAATQSTFPNQPSGSKVDSSYVKLYMDNAWAEYLTIAESATNAIVCDDSVQRNRLRATPLIGPWTSGSKSGVNLGNIDTARGPGYFTGNVNLPESFYMYPYGGYTNGAWSASGWMSNLSDSEDAALKYVTTEGIVGTVDIDGASHPMTSGNYTVMDNIGMHLDFDSATRTIVELSWTAAPAFAPDASSTIVIKPSVGASYTFSVGTVAVNGNILYSATSTTLASNIVAAMYRLATTDPDGWGALFVEAYADITSAAVGKVVIYLSGSLDATTPITIGATIGSDIVGTATATDYTQAPRTVRLVDTTETAWIQLALLTSRMKDIVGWDCDSNTPLSLIFNVIPGATNAVAWDENDKTVTISMNRSSMPSINTMYSLLVANSDVQALFAVSKMTDSTLGTYTIANAINYSWSGADLFLGYDPNVTLNNVAAACPAVYPVVPTCFKNTVDANAYTFKTGNGFDRSSHFYSRDVQVGDRVRWQVTTPEDVTITCSTKVSALDTDMTPATVGAATPAPANIGYSDTNPSVGTDQSATISAIEVTPGSDNQRAMDGTYSAVKTLSNILREYPGDYTNGLVSDTFTVEITTKGAAGTAKCAVTNSTGSYTRVDVPIEAIESSSAQVGVVAMAYLGNNLYIQFSKASTDSDAVFQVGDTYTFSAPAYAAYESVDEANVYASGTFVGSSDTTYVIQVSRGGVFNRATEVSEGLNGISVFAINYVDLPADGDTIELSSSVDSYTYTHSTPSGTATAWYQAVATAITDANLSGNSYQRFRAFVVETDSYSGTLYIYGPSDAMETANLNERYKSATATRTVIQAEAAVVDWESYGDRDDEYIVTCVTSGNISTARFSSSSVGGDSRGSIAFAGYGNAGNNYQNIGSSGVQLRFLQQDQATKVLAFTASVYTGLNTKVIYFGTNNIRFTYTTAGTLWTYEAYIDGAWVSQGTSVIAASTYEGLVDALNVLINEAYADGRTSIQGEVVTATSSLGAVADATVAVGQTAFSCTAVAVGSYVDRIAYMVNTALSSTAHKFRTTVTSISTLDTDHYDMVIADPYVIAGAVTVAFYDINDVELVSGVTATITGTSTISNVALMTASTGDLTGYVAVNDSLATATVVKCAPVAIGGESVVEVDDATFFTLVTPSTSTTTYELARTILTGNVADLNTITTSGPEYVTIPSGYTHNVDAAPWFEAGNYWVVKVMGSRPQVSISDTSGADQTSTSIVNDGEAINLGTQGAYIVFESNNNTLGGFAPGGGLAKGEKFFVACQASAPGPYKVLVLADDIDSAVTAGKDTDGISVADPDRFGAWMYLVKSGVQIPSKRPLELSASPTYNWWLDTNVDEQDIINVNSGIHIQDSGFVDGAGNQPYLEVFQGELYVEYRSLLTDYSDAIYSIDDIGDVEDTLGTLHPDNPLAYGVYKAMDNMTRRSCYFMAIPSNDMSGWSSIINLAERNRDIYAFAPCTQSNEVFELDEAHINAMSVETTKSWRIGFFAPELPEMIAVYNKNTNPYQEEWTAEISDDRRYPGAQYRRVEFSGQYSPTAILSDVKAGDMVRHSFSTDAWGSTTYVEDTVLSVESNTVLYLKHGLDAPTGTAIKVEIYHVYSVAEMADVIAETSAAFANRRIGSVFPAYAGSNGVVAPGWAVACAVAGLRCSIPPQQPMTNIAINGFDDLVLCYKTFSVTQLNKMAEYGTLIVMQDTAGGEVYIRHQLTSAAREGDLNTSEFSITTNFDSCSYYFASVLAPFIGRYNITPQLIEVIQTQIESGINYLSSFTGAGLLGPQLIKDDGERKSEIKTLMQHPTLRDRLYAVVDLAMPYPFNNIELHLAI